MDTNTSGNVPQASAPKSRKNLIIIILVLLVVLFLGGKVLGFLGRNAAKQAIEQATDGNISGDGTSGTITTKDGSVSYGTNSLPTDWPTDVPVYTNGTIQYSASSNQSGQTGKAVVILSPDSVATVKSYYTSALPQNGWTIKGTQEANGATVIVAEKSGRNLSLSIVGSSEGTQITLGTDK
ncbi:MAG: hypothetical protein PHS53_02525 [Candidatus Pacebacteria bacterium]|nr:hypothetical protein [Candidatus Paceibacterota bacterium]MDD5356998.1 hypothetical protein [Candidatus Paceibacterota bacterium]